MNKMNIPFTIESDKILDLEDLLPRIPSDFILKSINKKELEDAEVDLVSKINNAVDNAITPLPLGISAIGELLAHSSDQVDSDTIRNIGWLIEALGRQMFALSNLQEVSKSILTSNKGLKGDNGGLMS